MNGVGGIVLGGYALRVISPPLTVLQVSNGTLRTGKSADWQALSLYPCEVITFPDRVKMEEFPAGSPLGMHISVETVCAL